MTIATLGVDLGKDVFHLVGLDEQGQVVERAKKRRSGLMRYLAQLKPCHVAMEACAGAHHVARKAEAMGHRADLLPAQYVKPYTKSQKNDSADAAAIAEAATRPTMRQVEVKSIDQQELQLLLRQREGWLSQRTETANRIRGILLEFGITLPKNLTTLRREVPFVLEDGDNELPDRIRDLLATLLEDLRHLDHRIESLTQELQQRVEASPDGQRLLTIPGIGPMTATALLATVGSGHQFRRGRDLSAFLGLVPQQWSTGGQTRLGRIPKRGDRYLRVLLIHGARSLMRQCDRRDDPLAQWARALQSRKAQNAAVVGLANKMARIAWAVLAYKEPYRPQAAAA